MEVLLFGRRPGDKTSLSRLCPWTQGRLPVKARGHVQSVHSRVTYSQLCFSESGAAQMWVVGRWCRGARMYGNQTGAPENWVMRSVGRADSSQYLIQILAQSYSLHYFTAKPE